MKNLILLILLMYFACGHNISVFNNQTKLLMDDSYQVIKIDSLNNYYLIYAENNDRLYKIVSRKEDSLNGIKIQVNNYYKFDLFSIRDSAPTINGVRLLPQNYLDIECYTYDENTAICIERDSIIELHHSRNIKGRYFIEE
ncbi:MAG: hypothetical protein ACOCUV_02705 [bacterium]